MAAISASKVFPVKPSGLFDFRSDAGEIGVNDARVLLNISVTDEGKPIRSPQWRKLFGLSQFGFLNQDLHEQLLDQQQYYPLEGYNVAIGNYDIESIYDFTVEPGQAYYWVKGPNESTLAFGGGDDVLTESGEFISFSGNVFMVGNCALCPVTGSIYKLGSAYDLSYCGHYAGTLGGCREAQLLLHEFINEFGARKLVVFTQKRIYELNEEGGNYRLLADGLGSQVRNNSNADCQPCAGPRWQASQLLGYLIMTNGVNPVMSYRMGDSPDGCNLWSAKPIEDLETLGITHAGALAEFKGFILLGDVEQDGVRYPGRIFWSDFNQPLSWLPLPGTSLASYANVGFSDKVLRIEPLGDYVMVYTDAAIYRGQLNITLDANQIATKVFEFTRIYQGPHALRFKYSLVNTGTEHLYATTDGIYVIDNPFTSAPRRVEWIHKASGVIYTGATRWSAEFQSLPPEVSGSLQFGKLNEAACDNFIGGYDATRKHAWFSWPTDQNPCANMSLRLNFQYQASGLVDKGFSAFGTFRSDTRQSWEQWLSDLGVCPSSTWNNPKQGFMQGQTNFTSNVLYIWNEEEDFNIPASPDSMCYLLRNTTVDDLCEGCQAGPIFIGASTEDLTLKEFDDEAYFRELYTGNGYVNMGYPSLMQSGAYAFGSTVEKTFSRINFEYKALAQTTPSLIYAMAGFGAQESCPTWRGVGNRPLKCLTDKTRQQHEAQRTRPSVPATFPFSYRGTALWYRLFSSGMGGGHSFDGIGLTIRNAQTSVS